MRVPFRKPGKYSLQKPDNNITGAKFDEFKRKLTRLKEQKSIAMQEVSRLAELGDFSENMEYQLAKGRLRGINQKILEIEYALNNAEIIEPDKNINAVRLGHTVTVEVNNKMKMYQILGSAETNPSKNIISHNSPLGLALMGRSAGEVIWVETKDKNMQYKIIKIE